MRTQIVLTILTGIFFILSLKYEIAWIGAYLFGSIYTLRSTIESLRHKDVDVDLLMLLGALGAAYLGKFHEGSFLLLLFNIGSTLESYAFKISRESLKSLLSLKPEKAKVLKDGNFVEVPVEDVRVGDRILVKAGERVPVDGKIIKGKSSVDLSVITGEYIPEIKKEGDTVVAGALLIDGSLEIEAETTSKESTIEKIINLVMKAQEYKSKTQTLADWIGKRYTIAVLLSTPLVYLIFHVIYGSFDEAFYRTLIHLVVSSPCAFVISTPISVMSAIASSAKRGILFKGGAVVEEIHKVKWIAMDKTGTITIGKPRVKDIEVVCNCHDKLDILSIAASLEYHITHPIAEAIVKEGERKKIEIQPVNDVQYILGYGVKGKLNGNLWEISSDRSREGMVLSVKKDGKEEAKIILEDKLRENAKEALDRLKSMGYRIIIISGDKDANVRETAEKVGIRDYISEASPERKLAEIRKLSEEGGCCMVGDGINDGPALAAATFGIAMGTLASDVAVDVADVNVLSDNLKNLPKVFEYSKKSYSVILQNIIISLGSIAIMIILNLVGTINIMWGVLGHEGTTVIVALNGLRLLFMR